MNENVDGQELKGNINLGPFETTDPRHHNPQKFRYVVHAVISDSLKSTQALIGAYTQQDGHKIERQHDPIDATAKFPTRSFISCSVIDQEHMGTFAKQGLILGVQKENVLLTNSSDAGVRPSLDFDEHLKERELVSFEELLQMTTPGVLNEIVVRGSEGYPPINIQGVFIKTNVRGEPFDFDKATDVKELAERLGIPVVEFKAEKPPDHAPILTPVSEHIPEKMVSMVVAGVTYNYYLEKNDNGPKFFINEGGNGVPMSAKERQIFLEALEETINNGSTDLQPLLTQLHNDAEADVEKKYQRPDKRETISRRLPKFTANSLAELMGMPLSTEQDDRAIGKIREGLKKMNPASFFDKKK